MKRSIILIMTVFLFINVQLNAQEQQANMNLTALKYSIVSDVNASPDQFNINLNEDYNKYRRTRNGGAITMGLGGGVGALMLVGGMVRANKTSLDGIGWAVFGMGISGVSILAGMPPLIVGQRKMKLSEAKEL